VAASMMLASTIASAGAVYKCASGSGSFVYQDQPCPGGSALVAPISTGGTSGAAANRQVSPLCLKQVATKPAASMALQLERVRVHSRMKVFSMSMAAPAPDDDAVKRGKCEDIVTRYDSLLTELNHSDLDDLKKLGQCFISQSYLLHAEQAKLSCGLGG
ncbi:MAG: DUF4124 domain-containing protein, partial [Thiobacillus sp.]|nr:DUF4124 domain-containing protein [Thiobacillus sp.]